MKTILHVNQHNIQGNVVAKLVYRADKPLVCGAKVWIETKLDVEVV